MKTPILIIVMFSFSLLLNAQNCKFDSDTKDAFTGKQKRVITAKVDKGYSIIFNLSDDNFSVELYFDVFGEKNELISKGDSFLIKLSNNEIITLAASVDAAPTTYVSGTSAYGANITTYYKPNYSISPADFKKLAENLITDTRIFIGSNALSNPVANKNAVKIMHAANCILE